LGRLYAPPDRATARYWVPVGTCCAVMVASLTGAPSWLVTNPVIALVVTPWATAVDPATELSKRSETTNSMREREVWPTRGENGLGKVIAVSPVRMCVSGGSRGFLAISGRRWAGAG
jgi:hypothetical protein